MVEFTNADINIGSAYDTSSYRFTPTTAGRYFLTGSAQMDDIAINKQFQISIRKNGTDIIKTVTVTYAGLSDPSIDISALVEANGTTDYYEFLVWHDDPAGARSLFGESALTFFNGFLVSGGPGETGDSVSCDGTSTTTINLSDASVAEGNTLNVTTQSGKCWVVGQYVIIYSNDSSYSDQYVCGRVKSYSGTTLTITIGKKNGSNSI